MQCISTITYSVSVNGEPNGRISPKAGLRQGDPLSPYIFILYVETLSRNLLLQQEVGSITGLKITRNAHRPRKCSTCSFADALFFMKGTMDKNWNLKKTFDQFCKPSGEMVNLKVIHGFQQEHHSKVH